MNYKTKFILFLLMATLFTDLLFMGTAVKAKDAKPIILNLQVPIGDEAEVMDIGPNSIGTYIKAMYKYG
ncbi:MAG: hypothetical protein V1692_00635, partial [bacterium]